MNYKINMNWPEREKYRNSMDIQIVSIQIKLKSVQSMVNQLVRVHFKHTFFGVHYFLRIYFGANLRSVYVQVHSYCEMPSNDMSLLNALNGCKCECQLRSNVASCRVKVERTRQATKPRAKEWQRMLFNMVLVCILYYTIPLYSCTCVCVTHPKDKPLNAYFLLFYYCCCYCCCYCLSADSSFSSYMQHVTDFPGARVT